MIVQRDVKHKNYIIIIIIIIYVISACFVIGQLTVQSVHK